MRTETGVLVAALLGSFAAAAPAQVVDGLVVHEREVKTAKEAEPPLRCAAVREANGIVSALENATALIDGAAAVAELSPAQIVSAMEGHVAAQNARLAAAIRNGDRAFLNSLGLSSRQAEVLLAREGTFAMQYGNAMERAVAQAFERDCALRGMIADTRNVPGAGFPKVPGQRARRPDFTFTSGPMQGNIVDLTTAGGRAGKMAKYHDGVLTLEYVIPTF